MMILVRCSTALALGALLCGPAAAATVTLSFDDVSTTSTHVAIPNGQYGFNWDNFRVLHTDWYNPNLSGFMNGAVSGEYVAFNYRGDDARMMRVGGEEFDFVSAQLISGWRIGLDLEVTGYRDGQVVEQETILGLSNQAPAQYEFGFLNVDELRFHAYGGVVDGSMNFSSTAFGMDDVAINDEPTTAAPLPGGTPEPLTALGIVAGLGGLAAYVRRRRVT